MTQHIYAHEHPESDRKREGGFTLWFTGLSGSGKSTIAHLVAIEPLDEEPAPLELGADELGDRRLACP